LAIDAGVFLAAAGITILELAEAGAVALALYGASGKQSIFLSTGFGVIVILVPTLLLGSALARLPGYLVNSVAAVLLVWFGVKLMRSARRSLVRGRSGNLFTQEEPSRHLHYAAFSVGAVEAFEAGVVIVALLPKDFTVTVEGFTVGVFAVILATYALRSQVRKVKQAQMKEFVSAILLSFGTFWGLEVGVRLSDLLLIPLFVLYLLLGYLFTHAALPVRSYETARKP
jgi:uncharacterized membrane protein